MLAILGLLGLAVAGTAFVGLTPSEEDFEEDVVSTTAENTAELGDISDLFDDFEVAPQTEAGDSGGLTAQTSDDYDEFYGDEGDDYADGQGDHDYLDGRGGDDTLVGGGGDDHLHGGAGDDDVSGDDGDDLVYGYIGDDEMSGGAGNDVMHAGDGSDVVRGGQGNDEILGGAGDDTLFGGAGRDNIQGSEGDDFIDGITGEEDGAERDYLNGSAGNDILIGNDGDVMSGGADADRFEIDSGMVSIMDFAEDDILVLNYDGETPDLTTETTDTGIVLLANGTPVASLYGLTSFDTGNVQLVAS